MKALPIIAATLTTVLSLQALSHIEMKVYQGTDANGAPCSVDVKSKTYLNNTKHPLNERVDVVYNGKAYSLRHPETVNVETGEVAFEHDYLQGVLATPSGSLALTLILSHEPGQEGPKKFVASEHSWKDGSVYRLLCTLN